MFGVPSVGTRAPRPPKVALDRGEKVLAWAEAADGSVLVGSHDHLHIVGGDRPEPVRVRWEQVEAVSWDATTSQVTISEVGTWGDERPEHVLELSEAGRVLEVVRERVTASIILQRHVELGSRAGMRVIARRAPRGEAPVSWVFEYDEGVDPQDPAVRAAATMALAQARVDVGLD